MHEQGRPRRFAIATPHTAATQAGQAAFDAGGNAVDAALAAACALAVVYPHMCALGGDVMALVHDGQAHAINGSGRAPGATPPHPTGERVPVQGVGAITVPGAVSAWQVMAERWGTRPLAAATAAAAELASKGVTVASSLASALATDQALVAADAGMSQVFSPAGRILEEGDLLVQPRLSQTLERLGAVGADDFYRGELGRTLVRGLSDLGCPLTLDDFDAHRTDIAPALRYPTGDHEVLTMGANSQGFSLVQILAGIERLGLDDPLGRQAPILAALFRESAADRDTYLADPEAMDRPIEALISDEHVAELAARALAGPDPAASATPPARGDTVAVVAVDASGLAVSLIQSVFYSFGAGVLEPSTGVICHNRGACFSADPRSPNAPGPGKRPLHTLMPLIVTADDRPAWVAGTMGGKAQPQIHTQLFLRHLMGADTETAIASPRFVTGALETGGSDVQVEEDFVSALEAFAEAGVEAARLPPRSEATGHAQAIAWLADGTFDAASDPRADGRAAGS
jgi:gamma-glutamyltranspeptidase